MSVANEAKECVSTVRQFAASELRERYKWMKDEAIKTVLDQVLSSFEDLLIDQEEAMDAAREKTGFLRLPAEIRNRIYELTILWPQNSDDGICVSEIKSVPALLQSSSQVRRESASIYYGQTTFWVDMRNPVDGHKEFWYLIHWLKSIGSEQAKMVRSIRLLIMPTNAQVCFRTNGEHQVQLLGTMQRKSLGSALPPRGNIKFIAAELQSWCVQLEAENDWYGIVEVLFHGIERAPSIRECLLAMRYADRARRRPLTVDLRANWNTIGFETIFASWRGRANSKRRAEAGLDALWNSKFCLQLTRMPDESSSQA